MKLKKIGNVLTSKFVGTGPSSYAKRIYRAAVSQRLRNTALDRADTALRPISSITILNSHIWKELNILEFTVWNCRWDFEVSHPRCVGLIN